MWRYIEHIDIVFVSPIFKFSIQCYNLTMNKTTHELHFPFHETKIVTSCSSTLLDHLMPSTSFVVALLSMQHTYSSNHRQPWITRQKKGICWHYLIWYWPLLSSTNTVTNNISVNLARLIMLIYCKNFNFYLEFV